MSSPVHLHPTAPLAERVLLPGDPGRALRLAQALLAEPRPFNDNRGLWGYTGTAPDGGQLTIQSTGIGGPSAAIVVHELWQLGARTLVRVGTCGALDPSLRLGVMVLAGEAVAADGTSRALGAGERVAADSDLVAALVRAGAPAPTTVVSTDLFYESDTSREQQWAMAGAVAVEMVSAAVFALAATLGISAASVLTVSDLIREPRQRIDVHSLHAAEREMGKLALRALRNH